MLNHLLNKLDLYTKAQMLELRAEAGRYATCIERQRKDYKELRKENYGYLNFQNYARNPFAEKEYFIYEDYNMVQVRAHICHKGLEKDNFFVIKAFRYIHDDEHEYARMCAEELLEKLKETM